MNHFSIELSLLAVVPAVILCAYVFFKDRIEKEPIGLLVLLFGVGAAVYVPVNPVQNLAVGLIDGVFADKVNFSAEGAISYASRGAELSHAAICAFGAFSVVQIFAKWCVLFFATRKNRHFNYLFDGIVYSVFISLGFAVMENIYFLIQNDASLALSKLLASVPCHLFVGIVMGAYYTTWHVRYTANVLEKDMLKAGIVEKDRILTSAPWLAMSLVLPVLVSGLYNFAGVLNSRAVNLVFYVIVFVLYGASFIVIDFMASKDGSSSRYLCRIIAKGHPEVSFEVVEKIVECGVESLSDGGDKE